MEESRRKTRVIGGLILAGMGAGILSVVPAIDSQDYLSRAAGHPTQIMIGAAFQFIMAITNLAVAILFYPMLRQYGKSLAIGFVALRLIAATLVIIGTGLLASILVLSQEFVRVPGQDPQMFSVMGHVLKATRDHINHVYMILALSGGNILLYILLIRSRLVPLWLSLWGAAGISLTAVASVLILFQSVDVISSLYIALNMPTAFFEAFFAIWLVVKGLDT